MKITCWDEADGTPINKANWKEEESAKLMELFLMTRPKARIFYIHPETDRLWRLENDERRIN